jgi:hypothetical protein
VRRLLAAVAALALAAAWAAAQGAGLNARAKHIQESVAGMRAAQQSLIFAGFDGELAALAAQKAEAVIAAKEAEGTPAENESLEEEDLKKEALETLEALAAAYQLRQRGRFMNKVCEDFSGGHVLEDAFVMDARNYATIVFNAVPENEVVKDNLVTVRFRYFMALSPRGTSRTEKFEGRTRFDFKRGPNGKVCLAAMADRLFGTTIPLAQMPLATKQGPSVSRPNTIPGAQAVTLDGSGTIVQDAFGNNTFFSFRTLAQAPQSSADMGRAGTNLRTANGATIVAIGSCSLNTIKVVPTSITSVNCRFTPGQCCAVKTSDGLYHVLKMTSIGGGGSEWNFNVRSRRDGTNCINDCN